MNSAKATPIGDREALIGYLCTGALLFLWSGFILLSRFGVGAGFPPLDMTALRFVFALAVMAPIAARFGFFGMPWVQVLGLSATGGLGMALFAFHGFQFAPAAHAGVLMPGLLPLWAALLAWALLGQRPVGRRWLGLALILAGGGAVGAESFLETRSGSWRGDLLFPCASLCWAVFGTLVRRWSVPTLAAANAAGVGGALLYLPFWALTTDWALLRSPWETLLLWGVFQGVLTFIVSMLLYNRAVNALGPVRPALVTSLVPGCVAVAAVPLLGEALSGLQIAGLVMTMIGMVIALGGPGGGPAKARG